VRVSEPALDATASPPSVDAGDPRVDAIVGRLDAVAELDLAERASAFAEMEGALAAVLDTDEHAGTSTGAP
jgi:hypothetical protein